MNYDKCQIICNLFVILNSKYYEQKLIIDIKLTYFALQWENQKKQSPPTLDVDETSLTGEGG
jgi:hypothetical protein